MVNTIGLELCTFEVRWLMVVICPAAQLFADMRTLRTEISALRDQSEQEVVYIVLCSLHVYYPHRKLP